MLVFVDLAMVLGCIGLASWILIKLVGNWITRDRSHND